MIWDKYVNYIQVSDITIIIESFKAAFLLSAQYNSFAKTLKSEDFFF